MLPHPRPLGVDTLINILLDFYHLYQVRFLNKLEVGNQIWSAATD